jgi:hypothetical protein
MTKLGQDQARAGATTTTTTSAGVEDATPGKRTMLDAATASLRALYGSLAATAEQAPAEAAGDPLIASKSVAGSRALQRVLETGSRAELDAMIDALQAAMQRRDPLSRLDEVVVDAGDLALRVEVLPRITEAMIPAAIARRDRLETGAADPVWQRFADQLATHFKDILHVFDLGETRDDERRDPVGAERLQFLFTPDQRTALLDYFDSKLIPDRLFDGDDVGRLSAQQRILIASKILADGRYRPGSYVQEVHARACFHWVRIVWQYAGVTTTKLARGGITGEFDLQGGLVLGAGSIDEPFHAKRDRSLAPTSEHLTQNPAAWRFGNAPWAKVRELQPGDWLYVYNGNKSLSGAHSVVFAGWKSAERTTADGRHYRLASTYDQSMPGVGGNRHDRILGEDVFPVADDDMRGTTQPVNEIMRVDPDAMPPQTVDDLTPDLSRKVGAANRAFVAALLRKHGGAKTKTFDHAGLMTWLRAHNRGLIDKLAGTAGRLSPGQHALLLEANASFEEHDVICLTQRLEELAHNSGKLAERTEETYGDGGLDTTNTLAWAEYGVELASTEVDHWALTAELGVLALQAAPLQLELDFLLQDEALAALAARRVEVAGQVKGKRGEALKAKLKELKGIDDQRASIQKADAKHAKRVGEIKKQLAAIEKRERAVHKAIAAADAAQDAAYPHTEYGLVHNASSQGQTSGQPIDGRYEHIPGEVPWDQFVVPAPASSPAVDAR